MGVFAQTKAVKASGGTRNYFKEGMHRCTVDSVKFDRTREKNGKSDDIFAVEYTVVRTDSADPSMGIGRRVDWANISNKDIYFNNVKAFMIAILGISDDEYNAFDIPLPADQVYVKASNGEKVETQGDKLVDLVAGTEQIFAGKLLDASCVPTEESKPGAGDGGKIFPKWCIVPDEEQVEGFRGVTPEMILKLYPTGAAKAAAIAAGQVV